jgi:hypothetical protein
VALPIGAVLGTGVVGYRVGSARTDAGGRVAAEIDGDEDEVAETDGDGEWLIKLGLDVEAACGFNKSKSADAAAACDEAFNMDNVLGSTVS